MALLNVWLLALVSFLSIAQTGSANLRNGWRLFEEGRLAESEREFNLALQERPQSAAPRLGLAMIRAAEGRFKEGEKLLRIAETLSKTREERLTFSATAVRYYTQGRFPKDWLERARRHFNQGLRIRNDFPELLYRMAKAYAAANDLRRAQDLFAQVVSLKSDFSGEADREWKKAQKVLRASPATRTGAGIAMQDRVSRAELCTLLAGELAIDRLFRKRSPQALAVEPPDVREHRLRQDILTILRWQVRGLEVRPSGSFDPDEAVRRGEFAFVLEDVLIKATGDQTLATRYVGTEPSPFKDVASSYAWFNAIMTSTSRGLLEADIDGAFRSEEELEGADALLALRKLAGELR